MFFAQQTRKSLSIHTRLARNNKFQVTNVREVTISQSSGRHRKPYGRPRKGGKQETPSAPLVEVQETKRDPEAVALRPTDVSQIYSQL